MSRTQAKTGAIYTAPLSAIEDVMDHHHVSRLVSLLEPSAMIETPAKLDPALHLRLGLNDLHAPGESAPGANHIDALLSFVRRWDEENRRGAMLIHCRAGISRSTAAGFIAMCCLNASTDEDRIAQTLRRLAAHAQPNRRLVELADATMERGGRMVQAVEAMTPARIDWEGVVVELPSRIPASRD